MTNPGLRPAEVAALADALRASGLVRVSLDDLWTFWAAAAPRLVGDPAQASGLAAAVRSLDQQGVIELPIGAWDASTTPPLPRSLVVPSARRPARDREWLRYPWRQELGWVASLSSVSDERLRDLIAINSWLGRTNGEWVPVVPVRYRSVEILGHEKTLEAIARTNLFGPKRLSLELLACVRRPAPLPAVSVGPGDDLLVVENSDTYWVAVDALRTSDTHSVGAVAWGCGKAFPSQVGALSVDVAGRGPITGEVWYWGDLDPAGLTIAAEAAKAAKEIGAPPIRPACDLWIATAGRPIQEPGHFDWSAEPGRDWVGAELWDQFSHVRDANGRVAQESVPFTAIIEWARQRC